MQKASVSDLSARLIDDLKRRVDKLEGIGDSDTEFGGGNGGNGGDMDLAKRVENLEKSLSDTRDKVIRVDAVVESIKQHGSTKADVEAMGRTIIQWMVLTGIGIGGLAFAAARYIHP